MKPALKRDKDEHPVSHLETSAILHKMYGQEQKNVTYSMLYME
jgi:hypothetical protein